MKVHSTSKVSHYEVESLLSWNLKRFKFCYKQEFISYVQMIISLFTKFHEQVDDFIAGVFNSCDHYLEFCFDDRPGATKRTESSLHLGTKG